MEGFSNAQWESQLSALRSRLHSARETSERVKDELIVNRSRQDKISQEAKAMDFVTGITNIKVGVCVCVLIIINPLIGEERDWGRDWQQFLSSECNAESS